MWMILDRFMVLLWWLVVVSECVWLSVVMCLCMDKVKVCMLVCVCDVLMIMLLMMVNRFVIWWFILCIIRLWVFVMVYFVVILIEILMIWFGLFLGMVWLRFLI